MSSSSADEDQLAHRSERTPFGEFPPSEELLPSPSLLPARLLSAPLLVLALAVCRDIENGSKAAPSCCKALAMSAEAETSKRRTNEGPPLTLRHAAVPAPLPSA